MLRLNRSAFCRSLASASLGLTLLVQGAIAQTLSPRPEAPAPASSEPPIYIFLNAPADLDAFWKHWNQPDFVLQKGVDYQKLLDLVKGATRSTVTRRSGIESVAVLGAVLGDLAHLTIEFGITVVGQQPVWIPIRLDGLTVTAARDGDRDLMLREAEGGWQVEVNGEGRHRVRVALLVPVKPTTEGKRLELAIPEVGSTQIQLDVGQKVVDAAAGTKEIVAVEPIEAGQRTRLQAHLTPRSRLELTWRFEEDPGLKVSPLLSTRGEIALDIEPGSFRTRSSWVVSCSRGVVRSLEVRLDPDDEILDLELDDQPLPIDRRTGGDSTTLTIPLAEPMRAGSSREILVTTRRSISADASSRRIFRGFPLSNALAQTGVVAVGQAGNLWIDGSADRGLRQIDLRELPADLRARPATVLAYQFLEQPFELDLRVEPSPPLVRVEARSTLTVDAGLARLDTRLDYHVARGRVFELAVRIPQGLEFESAGPEDVVDSYHWLPEAPDASLTEPSDARRVLTLRLSQRARDEGSFQVHLTGRQAIDPARQVALALFQPRGSVAVGGRIAVLTARNVTAELSRNERTAGQGAGFTPEGLDPPSDWPWPADRAAGFTPPTLWLRYDGNPPHLPLEVAVQPRTLHHETTVTARIERRRIDVLQDTVCHVHYGTLTRLDVDVPPALEGLWDVDGEEIASRQPLKIEPDGQHRYRLTFSREVADIVRLRFRYRLPLEPGLAPDRPVRLGLPWLRILEGTSSSLQFKVAGVPGVQVVPEGSDWFRSTSEEGPASPLDSGSPVWLTLVRPSPDSGTVEVVATARALAPLPTLLATRLWLRTVLGPEGDLRTTCWYRVEIHDRSAAVALPAGAQLIRARLGSETLSEVEHVASGSYRIRFPEGTSAGPALLGLEYTISSRSQDAAHWSPPRLLEGGLVQETFWEVAVPWNQAVVGVPRGWTDENQWGWDVLVGKQVPWKTSADLSAWVAGPGSRLSLPEEPAEDGRGGYHTYLFRRQGEPSELRLWTVGRAWLVGICSGGVLALGVIILVWRPMNGLVSATALAFAVAVAAAIQPSVTLLLIQSSMFGVALTILASLTQRFIDRHRPARAVFGEGGGLAPVSTTGSALSGVAEVGSEGSTAIRVRPPSTRDHFPPPLSAAPENAVADGSNVEH